MSVRNPPSLSERSPGAHSNADSLAAWLDLVTSLLRLPKEQAAEIREELESHLRDRVRDLMLGGLDAEEAMTRAISELGDAADLAARFRSARRDSPRRQAMNMLGLGVAAGAAVISIAALVRPGGSPVAPSPETLTKASEAALPGHSDLVVQPGPSNDPKVLRVRISELEQQVQLLRAEALKEAAPTRPLLRDPLWIQTFKLGEINGKSFREAMNLVAAKLGLKLEAFVDIDAPEKFDLSKLGKMRTEQHEEFCKEVFDFFPRYSPLMYRIRGDTLQIGTREFFEDRDYSLRAYAVGGLFGVSSVRTDFRAGSPPSGQGLINTLLQLSPPAEAGERYGNAIGRVGNFSLVGPTLFVDGPEIVHERVRWILRQAAAGGWSPSEAVRAENVQVPELPAAPEGGSDAGQPNP